MFTVPTLIRLCCLYLFVLLLSPNNTFAQSSQCDCRENLEEVITKITDNYPGYPIKITRANEAHFKHFTDSLRKLADTATNVTCFPILQRWLSYFKDKHLNILLNDNPDNASFIRSTFATALKYPITEDSLLKKWESSPPHSLEGLWSLGNSLRVALVQKENDYIGVVTKGDNLFWTPGQVKFELKNAGEQKWSAVIYNRYHLGDSFTTYLDEHAVSISLKGTKWVKIFPSLKSDIKPIPLDSFYFSRLDSNTTLLRLPIFDLKFKPLIDSLITSNLDVIAHTPNLIVDLRGNLGGFNVCFEKLLPLIHTKDTIITPGPIIKATDDNIRLYEDLLNNKDFPEKDKLLVIRLIDGLKKHRNGYYQEPDEIMTYTDKYPQPKKVVLLIDEGCASATEFLILDAKQSKKVTLFGKRSAGIVDYSNLVAPRALSCSRFVLWCPTARSARLPQHPIDNIGIKPDVEIPDQENWINFVQQYIAKQELTIDTSK